MASLVVEGGTVELHPVSPTASEAGVRERSVLSISRELELSGSLVAHLPEGYELPAAGEFENLPLIVHWDEDGRVGDFEEFFVGDAQAGHQGGGEFLSFVWSKETDESGGLDDVLSLQAYQALPGDADGDGEVSFLDFLQLANAFGSDGDWVAGDFTGDGTIGFEDFLELANNFGQSASEVAVSSVPEPALALQLAGIACAVGFFGRRQRR